MEARKLKQLREKARERPLRGWGTGTAGLTLKGQSASSCPLFQREKSDQPRVGAVD